MIQKNYSFADNSGQEHIAPIVGFAYPSYDARNACVTAIDAELLKAPTFDIQAISCRDIGSPLLFICCRKEFQWWSLTTRGVELQERVSVNQIDIFFKQHRKEFSPESIYRAKNLGRIDKNHQLSFVDIGLMPLLEYEMGERLGGLVKIVLDSIQNGFTKEQLAETRNQQFIFRAGFWLLCAKILKDKKVYEFTQLDVNDIDAVFRAVKIHYEAQQQVQVVNNRQRKALLSAAGKINDFASLSNLTTEAFGYMYENVLVDKNLRTALGIHATPSYLVDYIVWQLWPWIKQIPEDKRVILEPACGHAPFLTGAMRLLRELYESDEKTFHKYAKRNLIGVEMDSFAREIARLSLTMADIPNPDGWKIVEGDIYRNDLLSEQAKNATILLCNPPFEDFTPTQQNEYRKEQQILKYFNKAAEMLWRTLPNMSAGSVFGVLVPRGFLHKENLADLREMMLLDFEFHQICSLPKKVFRHANHESVVLAGRKKVAQFQKDGVGKNKVLYRNIPREGLKKFREKYEGRDQYICQSKFVESIIFDFRVRELDDVWNYCERNFPKLASISEGGQGFTYKGRYLPEGAQTFKRSKFPGAVKGYALFNSGILLHGLPEEYWMNLASEVIRRPLWVLESGKAQILMNYAPVSADPWRLKALIDRKGLPVTSRFLVFRLQNSDWSLNALWAVLNSPLANAFIFAHTTDRYIPAGTARRIPVPICSGESLKKLERLVGEYFTLMEKKDSEFGIDIRDTAKRIFLSIDAEVMRLYDLPPKMEKQILDLFQGFKRKGVDFEFKEYYPEDFESWIPLHEYLSEDYQRSTISFVSKWVEEVRSPEIIKSFKSAEEAFKED